MLPKDIYRNLSDADKELVKIKLQEAIQYECMVHFCYGTLKPNSGNIVITQIDLEERENLEQYYRSGGQLDYCDPLKLAIDLKIQLVNDSDDLNIYNLSVA